MADPTLRDTFSRKLSVTRDITVSIDQARFDAAFWDEFNSSIVDRGGPDFDYLAQHIAWNYSQGARSFVEGVGSLEEMGVTVIEGDGYMEDSND